MRVIIERDLLADMGSVFQDFCDKHNFITENDEKSEAMKDDESSVSPTTLYGDDWDDILYAIEGILAQYNIEVEEEY